MIGGVAIGIVTIYIIRLFTLQIMSDDYKKNADSNAFLKQVEYPSRGAIYDRNGKLMVYNQPSYDIMVVMNEESGRLDTMDFCNSLGITKEFFIKRMNDIKDRSKIPVIRVTPSSSSWDSCPIRTSVCSRKRCSVSCVSMCRREAYVNTPVPMLPMCSEMWEKFRERYRR